MRSVSAFVKPSTQENAITAAMAFASGVRLFSASQVIGAPRMSRNAVGEPNSQ